MANLVMLIILAVLVYMFVERIRQVKNGQTPNIDDVLRHNMF